ncbi:MAG: hypothetical protein C0593_04880 [Marinilabiliales bacterium]|nr:MAG: hypothetical protein C0593_04880 [Marinilabiliales bacterium]
MKNTLRISLLLTFLITTVFSYAQISKGGTPISFNTDLSGEYEILNYNQPDMAEVAFQDQFDDNDPNRPQRAAVPVYLYIDMMEHATSELVGDKMVWRLGITVPEARALAVYYDRFWIPSGGELFLYNKNHKQVIGAFTEENNAQDGLFATELIQGDLVTLEYSQPAAMSVLPSIQISEVAYGYRFVEMEQFADDQSKDPSWWCMININCQEGDDWQLQKRGVVRQWMKMPGGYYGWCTGSLVNNTSWDLTPYVLTAGHCGEGCSASDLNQWIFYFNYESSTCGGSSGPESQTMTGCYKRAADESAGDNGSDFYLIEIKQVIPTSYEPYWNGWDASGTGSVGGVGIHHPNGDIKKISTYTQALQTSTWWNGLQSHWTFNWATTANGTSIVQGGSSGSPLFNSDGLIVGDLTGGYASNSCENPSPVWYGKFSYSWDQMGSTPELRLKDWLDPASTGEEVLPGTDGNDPIADFSADPQGTNPGGTIQFSDESMGNPENWEWTFEGGTPATSNEQNPEVTYNNYGTFDVTLTISNTFGSDTETKTDFIIVGDLPEAEFTSDVTVIPVGGQVDFQNLSTGDPTSQVWKFPGGSPFQSHNSNPPIINYYEEGTFNVELTVTNEYGSDTELKVGYITVLGTPQPDFIVDTAKTLPGGSIQFTDVTQGEIDTWNWTFEGGNPSTSTQQNPLVSYETPGMYDVTLEVSGSTGAGDTTKVDFITVVNPADAQFSANITEVHIGDPVIFSDESTGDDIQSWYWHFEGGFPEEWNEQEVPEVTYFTPGHYTVSLTVEGLYNADTETKEAYIYAGTAPEAAFEASAQYVAEGETVDFSDLSENEPTAWEWTFSGATPESSSDQNPMGISWNESGSYDVTLNVSNQFGSDQLVMQNYIHVSGVGIEELNNTINIFPNPSDGTFTLDISDLKEQISAITIISPNGQIIETIKPEISEKILKIDISDVPVGIYSVKIESEKQVITQQIQIVK